MPLYDHQCTSCNHEFEELYGINQSPPTECPECGKETVVRLISKTTFVLKGGGWANDDYSSSKS